MLIINNDYEVYNNDDEDLEIDKLYKARDLSSNSDICIKILKKNKYIKEDFLTNLIDLSIMDLKFSCSSYAKILHLEEHGDTYFVISEYFDGRQLKDLIESDSLTLEQINFIFNKIINCMKLCYNKGIYHGSLRLDNILVDKNFNVMIYDFGFTKANKGVNIRNHRDSVYFLSPHQINIDYTDMESDLFSLGVILYYCIFKKIPFGNDKIEKNRIKDIDRGVDFSKERINILNKGLFEISKKLLSRNDKYSKYDEILIDLSNIIYSDIEDDDEEEDYEYDYIKGFNTSFFIKILAIVLCIIILVMMILQM